MDHAPPPDITLKADDDVAKGRFSNMAQVASNLDAFVLDFAFVQGRVGWLLARMLLSPQHAKRFHAALGETLARHEERFGVIEDGSRSPAKEDPAKEDPSNGGPTLQ